MKCLRYLDYKEQPDYESVKETLLQSESPEEEKDQADKTQGRGSLENAHNDASFYAPAENNDEQPKHPKKRI